MESDGRLAQEIRAVGKGLLNRCASCAQDAHRGQQLMLGMIYRSALVSGWQLKFCFAQNLSVLKKVKPPTQGLVPCCPHPQPASEAKELFWVELGVGDLGRQGGELGRAEEPPLEHFLECRRGTPCLSSAFQQASCVPGSRPSRAVH